jgi:hypothetical protein
MGSKSRKVIWGGAVMGANMRAETAREEAQKAARAADRAEACVVGPHRRLWRASPAVANYRQCISGGYGWLEVECNRCKTGASLPHSAIRRPRDTPICKLEAALKCRSCRKAGMPHPCI